MPVFTGFSEGLNNFANEKIKQKKKREKTNRKLRYLPLNTTGRDEVLPMKICFRIVENFFGVMCFPYEKLR